MLYTFVDTAYLGGRSPDDVARQLCDGGSDLIQFRAKDWSVDQIEPVAERLLAITESCGVQLVINDHWDVAVRIGAPFCHLGQEDFFDAGFTHVSQLRKQHSTKLGLSTHAPGQAERAIAAGADYVAIGPVYPTGTKPGAKPVTLEYVRWAAANVPIPWYAIGGITLDNVEDVQSAGAVNICVVSAILKAPDIARACREFKSRLTRAGASL